ncbi:MAG: ATP-binding protein [Clostridia bacterium]|nr:ATP-binding protein [Clostridia bacterium]MDD4047390.1 ATP-binding protein [Clostridia bacterium]
MNLNDMLNNSRGFERKKTMKLNKIKVGGFKNTDDTIVELNNITTLVSLNSFGKSNLLQAIDFGVDFINSTDEEKRKMMSWIKGIPLTKSIASKDYKIEFEMQTTINEVTYNVIYGYQFAWRRDDNTGTRIVGEWLRIKLDDKNQKYNQYINRTAENSFYKTSETGRCSNKIAIAPNELIINKLKAFDGLFYKKIIKRINNLSIYIEKHFDTSSSYRLDPFIRTDMEALEIESSADVPRVIFCLKKQFPDKYQLLIDSFMQLFPQITDITVEELTIKHNGKNQIPQDLPIKVTNQLYVMNVTDMNLNQPINFESMSDGAKRVFLLLVCILLADINGLSLIAIEEPENSIHPSLLQSYLRVISQFLGKCKVIITSHSPYILQYLELSNIYIGLPNPKGVAKFSKIRQSMQKTLINEVCNVDMSVGDYIFDLLSGSEDAIVELGKFLENDFYE